MDRLCIMRTNRIPRKSIAEEEGRLGMEQVLPLISRWTHIISACALVGGLVFFRFVLIPVGEAALSAEVYKDVRTKLARRFQIISHLCLLLFFISGFYNYIAVTSPNHSGQGLYHMLFGIKFTFAMAAFVIVIMVTSKRDRGERMRENGRRWFMVALLVALVTVMLGGVMKMLPPGDAPEPEVVEADSGPEG